MIIVMRTYIPKAGKGGSLMRLIKSVAESFDKNNFPTTEILRASHGLHGKIQTIQRWDSHDDYMNSRDKVRATKEITSLFDDIYPLLEETHFTELFNVEWLLINFWVMI